jgi:hypothetical protein
MPDIPASWSQAIAAVGAIIVLILFMRFMTELMKGQGSQSATLIDRSFDIADHVVKAGVKLRADEPAPTEEPPVEGEMVAVTEPDPLS